MAWAWNCSAVDKAGKNMADTWADIVQVACAWDAVGTCTADSKDFEGTVYCYYAGFPPFRAQDCSSFHFFIFSYLFPACHHTCPSTCTGRDCSCRRCPCVSFYSSFQLHVMRVTVILPLDNLQNNLTGAVGFLFIVTIYMSGGDGSLGMFY